MVEFHEKLKKVTNELKLNQTQLAELIGIGKSSLSQYLSGTHVPLPKRQEDIAIALGLAPDYFEWENPFAITKIDTKIRRLDVNDAAKLLGMAQDTVRKGLQQRVFPWGYAIRTSENRWAYFINEKRFYEIERLVDTNSQLNIIDYQPVNYQEEEGEASECRGKGDATLCI